MRASQGRAGFSLAELLVVLAVVGILAAAGTPYFVRYWQSAKLRAAAEELATVINFGRQAAISANSFACVGLDSNKVRIKTGTSTACTAGTTWKGPGTDSNGNFTLAETVHVTGSSVLFNYLGAAAIPGSFAVINPKSGKTRAVVVAASGRVTISAEGL